MVNTVIVGTGDLAYALAHLYHINNTADSGHFLEVTKASIPQKGATFHETLVPLIPLDDALEHADVVILAIPGNALKTFIPAHVMVLKDKILVDCSNSDRNGEDLDSLIRSTGIRFVKAFNDLGAVDILANKATGKKKSVTKMCSSETKGALEVVRRLAEQSFGLDVKVVPYEHYREISRAQNTIGKEWIHSIYIMLITFVLTEFYAAWRYNVEKGYAWFHLPIQVTNKAICWTALTGFALTQLPGVIARISNLFRSTNLNGYSRTLKWALTIRKNLGILSLWFLGVHIIMSLLLMNPAYYGKFYVDPTANHSKMNVTGETSFFFAILGAMFYFILGLASLPSIGANMTNAQWQLIYGPLAWTALLFGTSHVLIMGVKGWADQGKWPGGLPPITLTSTLIPMLVIFLKQVEVALTFVMGLFGSHASKVKDNELNQIRSLIYEGSMQMQQQGKGNESGNESDDTHESGDSQLTSSTVGFNHTTGDVETQAAYVEDKV